MKISVLVDNHESWIVPYGARLVRELTSRGHKADLFYDPDSLASGDVLFLLGCEKIMPPEVLAKHTHNLVVHESALPEGRGFAPLAWQILERKNEIPIVLFEAVPEVDAGQIYFRDTLCFEGHELNKELRIAQGEKTVELALQFVDAYPNVTGESQQGEGSVYARRTPEDSELDPEKTIAEQFDQLRVADNRHHPAFFRHRGHRYVLRIEKEDESI